MQKFYGYCTDLGLDETTLNGKKLRNGAAAGLADCSLFFICGYDFVMHPNDMKFYGIENIFMHEHAVFPLNISPNFPAMFREALTGAKLAVQAPVFGGRKPMLRPKGIQPTGGGHDLANYNLRASALEFIVTDPNGMNYNQGLTSVMPNLTAAFSKPASPVNEFIQHDLDEMKVAVQPYWGGDTWRLGL